MTSATTRSATGTGGRHADGHGYGLVLFASALLVVVDCFNLIYGIAAIANSHVSPPTPTTCPAACARGAGSPSSSAPCRSWPRAGGGAGGGPPGARRCAGAAAPPPPPPLFFPPPPPRGVGAVGPGGGGVD